MEVGTENTLFMGFILILTGHSFEGKKSQTRVSEQSSLPSTKILSPNLIILAKLVRGKRLN